MCEENRSLLLIRFSNGPSVSCPIHAILENYVLANPDTPKYAQIYKDARLIHSSFLQNQHSVASTQTTFPLMGMVMYLFTAHLSWRFTTFSLGWDRTSASQGVSGSRYQSIFDLTNPHHGHPRMHVKFIYLFYYFYFFNSTLHNLNLLTKSNTSIILCARQYIDINKQTFTALYW